MAGHQGESVWGFLDGQEEAEPWLCMLCVWGTGTAQNKLLHLLLEHTMNFSAHLIIAEVLLQNYGSQKAATKGDSVTVGTWLGWSHVAPECSWL